MNILKFDYRPRLSDEYLNSSPTISYKQHYSARILLKKNQNLIFVSSPLCDLIIAKLCEYGSRNKTIFVMIL
jgi:hypothetical protein